MRLNTWKFGEKMQKLRQKGVSLYYQVEESIRKRINSGEWTKDMRIPSEPDLSVEYGVSRATIRQAIANLVSDGLLIRRQGLGTFVASPVFEGDYLKFFFPEELGGRHELFSVELQRGSRSVTEALNLPDGVQVAELMRLRYFGDETVPAVLEKSYFRAELLPLVKASDLSQKLYGIIEDILGITLTRFKNVIEPVTPTMQEAKCLQIKPNSPVLLISRTCYTDEGKAVVLTKSLIRADKCKLLVIS